MSSESAIVQGRYGADSELVDFILRITFEIWEGRGVGLIRQYYAADCVVYGLDAVQEGAEAMVESTHRYLEAFPDRLLLANDVIWSNDLEDGFYSSHRIESPMTNFGASAFGPATGKPVRVTAIADCVVRNGRIVREWLVRDSLALVRQLGFDVLAAARRSAESRTATTADWLAGELARVRAGGDCAHELAPFAAGVLRACWVDGGRHPMRRMRCCTSPRWRDIPGRPPSPPTSMRCGRHSAKRASASTTSPRSLGGKPGAVWRCAGVWWRYTKALTRAWRRPTAPCSSSA